MLVAVRQAVVAAILDQDESPQTERSGQDPNEYRDTDFPIEQQAYETITHSGRHHSGYPAKDAEEPREPRFHLAIHRFRSGNVLTTDRGHDDGRDHHYSDRDKPGRS